MGVLVGEYHSFGTHIGFEVAHYIQRCPAGHLSPDGQS